MREHETPSSESHIIIKIEMPTVSEIMNENTKYIYIYACTIYIYICMYNIYIYMYYILLYYIFIYNSYFAIYAVAYLDIKRTCT